MTVRLAGPGVDVERETLLPLKNVPHATYRTRRRWARDGIRGVRLETVFIGGRQMTSTEAVRRFFAALNAAPESGAAVPADAHRAAEDELDRLGI
jgi:hypothetical protein